MYFPFYFLVLPFISLSDNFCSYCFVSGFNFYLFIFLFIVLFALWARSIAICEHGFWFHLFLFNFLHIIHLEK